MSAAVKFILPHGLTSSLNRAKKVNIRENEQKQPWFIKLNPNGRIPVLVDGLRDVASNHASFLSDSLTEAWQNFAVFETSAILLYLAQHYDKDAKFSFDPVKQPNDYSEMLQWVFFAVCRVTNPFESATDSFCL